MGLMKQLIRSLKKSTQSFYGSLFGKKKRTKRRSKTDKPIIVPRSWKKPSKEYTSKESPEIKIKYKARIPGLRQLKRVIAGFLLLVNIVFSQFLLGSIGAQAQPMFIFFMANAFIMVDYLWKTRKAAE